MSKKSNKSAKGAAEAAEKSTPEGSGQTAEVTGAQPAGETAPVGAPAAEGAKEGGSEGEKTAGEAGPASSGAPGDDPNEPTKEQIVKEYEAKLEEARGKERLVQSWNGKPLTPAPHFERQKDGTVVADPAIEPSGIYPVTGGMLQEMLDDYNEHAVEDAEASESGKDAASTVPAVAVSEIRVEVRVSLPTPYFVQRGGKVPEYHFFRENRTDRWGSYVRRYLAGEVAPELAETGVFPIAKAQDDIADMQAGAGAQVLRIVFVTAAEFAAAEAEWVARVADQEEAERLRREHLKRLEDDKARLEQETRDVENGLAPAPAPVEDGKPPAVKGFNVSGKPRGLAEIEAMMRNAGG